MEKGSKSLDIMAGIQCQSLTFIVLVFRTVSSDVLVFSSTCFPALLYILPECVLKLKKKVFDLRLKLQFLKGISDFTGISNNKLFYFIYKVYLQVMHSLYYNNYN